MLNWEIFLIEHNSWMYVIVHYLIQVNFIDYFTFYVVLVVGRTTTITCPSAENFQFWKIEISMTF